MQQCDDEQRIMLLFRHSLTQTVSEDVDSVNVLLYTRVRCAKRISQVSADVPS